MISGVRASSTRIEFDLVDDREVVIPLQHLGEVGLHVVAQVVEAELVVGGVGDVGVVGGLLLGLLHPRHHHAYPEAERVIHHAHPVGVAAGEVVVDRDHVHAAPGQRVQVRRHRRHQGLALAGLHLRDVALVEEYAAHQLDVERPEAEGATGRLAGVGEGLGEKVVQGLALGEAVAEFLGLRLNAGVVERLELRLQRVDRVDQRPGRLDLAVVRRAEDLLRDRPETHHQTLVLKSPRARRAPLRRPRRSPPNCHDGGACSRAPNGLSIREARPALLRPARDVSGCAVPVNGAPRGRPSGISSARRHGRANGRSTCAAF